jgi:hypothetical protein
MTVDGSRSPLHAALGEALRALDRQASNDLAIRKLPDPDLKPLLTGLLAQVNDIRTSILPEVQLLHPRAADFLRNTLDEVLPKLEPYASAQDIRGPLCAAFGRIRDALQKVTINLRLLQSGEEGRDPFEIYEEEFPESARRTLEFLQAVTGFRKLIAETFHLEKLEGVATFLEKGKEELSPEAWQQLDGFFLYIAGALTEQFGSMKGFEDSMYLAELDELPNRQKALDEVAELHARIQILHAGIQSLPHSTDSHKAVYTEQMSSSIRKVVEILKSFQAFLDQWAQNIARRKYLQFKEQL